MSNQLTREQLQQLLNYDPETGVFTWQLRRNQHVDAGSVAGHVSARNGYRYINVRRKLHLAHRLAVFFMTGAWPTADVDHKNGERDDNRWSNLRDATRSENMNNLQRSHRDSKVGLLGVVPCNGRFAAHARVSGKNKYLGTFDTPEQAHQAWRDAKKADGQPKQFTATN
jgi:hypothetical protein